MSIYDYHVTLYMYDDDRDLKIVASPGIRNWECPVSVFHLYACRRHRNHVHYMTVVYVVFCPRAQAIAIIIIIKGSDCQLSACMQNIGMYMHT